jgi:hypothetical protein
MTNLMELFTYFLFLSVAAERAVEILKNMFLKKKEASPAVYQTLAAIFGGIMSYISPPSNIGHLNPYVAAIMIGLAVSGGSSFWNTTIVMFNQKAKSLKQE